MKKLIPNYLKQIDSYLLLNAPIIWISKAHYIMFFGLLMWLFSAIIGFIIPINLFANLDLGLWYFLFTILAIIALCFWIYRNVIFNIEKSFGNRHWTDEYKIFGLSFLSVFILMTFAFPFSIIYNNRVANTVTDSELINDINKLNIGEPYLVIDYYNYENTYDTIKNTQFYHIDKCINFEENTPYFILFDTLNHNLLSSYQLKKNYYIISKNKTDIVKAIQDYINVAKKYNITCNYSAQQYANYYHDLVGKSPVEIKDMQRFDSGINKYDLKKCVDNISEAKFKTFYIWKFEFLMFLFYSTFYITLLILLFKMVNWKQYLVTLITCVILPIILFIITMLVPYQFNNRNYFFLELVLLSFLVALTFSIIGAVQTNRFYAFRNVCLQLIYLTTPFIPLLLIVTAQQVFNVFYNYDFYSYDYYEMGITESVDVNANNSAYYYSKDYLYNQLLYDYGKRLFERWCWISVYGSTVLFILIGLPFFKHLFVKQIALPRKN